MELRFADGISQGVPYQFQTEQWLPFPRDLVFAFFANPQNLPPLMPGWQKARIDEATISPPPPRPAGSPVFPGTVAGSGTRLTITARGVPFLPLRSPWYALIEDFRWNEGFCDVQVKGPFSYWRHCHSVRDAANAEGRAGTVVQDHVMYTPPVAPLQALSHPAVELALGMLFRYRQARTVELLPHFATSCGVAATT